MKRALSLLLTIFVLAAQVGCTSWRAAPGNVTETVASQRRVRVELQNGKKVEFARPMVLRDTLFERERYGRLNSTVAGSPMAPVASVVKTETRQVSATRTLAFILAIPVGMIAVVGLACLSDGCDFSVSYP